MVLVPILIFGLRLLLYRFIMRKKRVVVPVGKRVSVVSTKPVKIVSRGQMSVRSGGRPFKLGLKKEGWRFRAKQKAKKAAKMAVIYAIIANGAWTIGNKIYRDMAKPNDFLLFRQEQAKRFGIVLTERAVPFKPSASLMREFKKEISETCKALGTDRTLVYSILRHECGFNPNAKSPKNARGPGQLVNIQIKQLENLGFTVSNPYSIGQSVEGCARTLKWMEENLKFNGSRKAFLSLPREKQLNMLFTAYNSGLARSNKLGPNYVSDYTKAVWSIYRKNLERNPFK